jgi:hypothetical protein
LKIIPSKRGKIPCSWTGKINILTVFILPKVIYRLNQVLSKYHWNSSQKKSTTTSKSCMKVEKTLNNQISPEQKEQSCRNVNT